MHLSQLFHRLRDSNRVESVWNKICDKKSANKLNNEHFCIAEVDQTRFRVAGVYDPPAEKSKKKTLFPSECFCGTLNVSNTLATALTDLMMVNAQKL